MNKKIIVGIDEAGRGPLAGPVVAAAVIMPNSINGVADSKKISAKKREILFPFYMRRIAMLLRNQTCLVETSAHLTVEQFDYH